MLCCFIVPHVNCNDSYFFPSTVFKRAFFYHTFLYNYNVFGNLLCQLPKSSITVKIPIYQVYEMIYVGLQVDHYKT